MRVRAALVSAAFLVMLAGPAQAALIGISKLPGPDIASSFLDIAYDGTSDALTAIGFALDADFDGDNSFETSITPPAFPNHQNYNLTATIDEDGVLSSGSFTITGTISDPDWDGSSGTCCTSGTLLTGNLTAFGFPENPEPLSSAFEFLFTITGGESDIVELWGGIGYSGGIFLSAHDYPGPSGGKDFGTDSWNNFPGGAGSGTGAANTFIPEPSTFLLVALGLGVLGLRRRSS